MIHSARIIDQFHALFFYRTIAYFVQISNEAAREKSQKQRGNCTIDTFVKIGLIIWRILVFSAILGVIARCDAP
jgi:hypothetical protein